MRNRLRKQLDTVLDIRIEWRTVGLAQVFPFQRLKSEIIIYICNWKVSTYPRQYSGLNSHLDAIRILSNSQTKTSHLLSGRISKKQAPDSQSKVWSMAKVWRLSVFHSLSRQKRMYPIDFPGLGLMNVAEVLPRTELTEWSKAQRGKVLSFDSFSKHPKITLLLKGPKSHSKTQAKILDFGFWILNGFWITTINRQFQARFPLAPRHGRGVLLSLSDGTSIEPRLEPWTDTAVNHDPFYPFCFGCKDRHCKDLAIST